MLYSTKEPPTTKKEDFLFPATLFNEDFDLHTIGAYEVELFENGHLQEEHAKELLNYAIYYARIKVEKDKSPYFSSFTNKDAKSASILDLFFKKLGLPSFQFNMGTTLGEENLQQLCMVEIPIIREEKVEVVSFLLDPTFRQYCLKEKNQFNIFFEKPHTKTEKLTPDPGYFLSLTKEGTEFAEKLITYGYFEVTEENLKMYFDAFSLHFTIKEKQEDYLSSGKIASTHFSSSYYKEAIQKNKTIYTLNIPVETPIETLYQKLNRGLNRFSKVNKILLKKYRGYLGIIRRNEMNSYSIIKKEI